MPRQARRWGLVADLIVAQSTADRDPGLGRKSNMREYRITLYPVRENPCCEKPRYPNPSCTECRGKAQKRRDPSTRTVGVPWVGTVTRLSWVTSAVIVARPLFARLEHGAGGHQADGQVAPQRNHELACHCHDGDAADPAFGVADALAEPLAQFALGLMS